MFVFRSKRKWKERTRTRTMSCQALAVSLFNVQITCSIAANVYGRIITTIWSNVASFFFLLVPDCSRCHHSSTKCVWHNPNEREMMIANEMLLWCWTTWTTQCENENKTDIHIYTTSAAPSILFTHANACPVCEWWMFRFACTAINDFFSACHMQQWFQSNWRLFSSRILRL